MKVRNALSSGIKQVFQNKKMWLVVFTIQLLFALVLLLPLRAQWESMLGHSLMGEEILQGYGGNVFSEFLAHYAKILAIEGSAILILGIVYLLSTIFLNGGIIDTYGSKDSFSANRFFGSAGRFFWRFIRIFLLSLPFIIVSFFLLRGLQALSKIMAGDSEPMIVIFWIIKYLIFLFFLFFIQMVFDYAKIRTVLEDRRDMLKTSLRSFTFAFKHFSKVMGLYWMIALIGIVVFAVFVLVKKLIPGSTGLGMLILFLWLQIYAYHRVGIKLLFIASQTNLYKTISGSGARILRLMKIDSSMNV